MKTEILVKLQLPKGLANSFESATRTVISHDTVSIIALIASMQNFEYPSP